VAWQLTFLSYLFGIIPFLFVLFLLPEPEYKARPEAAPKVEFKLPTGAYFFTILWGFMSLFTFPLMLNLSSIIILDKLGGPAAAGMASSMFTAGGILAGIVFGIIFKMFKKYLIAFGSLLMALGIYLVATSGTLAALTIGITLAGIGNSIIWPGMYMELGKIVSPEVFPKASGLMMALMNITSFISPYFMALVGNLSGNQSPRFIVLLCAIGYSVITVLYACIRTVKKDSAEGKAVEA
jgi:MFS family permease